jgi:hypothetical protein
MSTKKFMECNLSEEIQVHQSPLESFLLEANLCYIKNSAGFISRTLQQLKISFLVRWVRRKKNYRAPNLRIYIYIYLSISVVFIRLRSRWSVPLIFVGFHFFSFHRSNLLHKNIYSIYIYTSICTYTQRHKYMNIYI